MISCYDLDSLKLWPIQPVLTPRRAGPLISGRTLGVYTPIGVYTRLGFCALHYSCAPLGFCAPLDFCAPLSFCALLQFLHGIRLERLSVRALDFSIHSTPQPQVSRLIFTPHYCDTLYKITNAKPPIPSTPFYFSRWRGNNLFGTGYANSWILSISYRFDLYELHILFLPLLATKTRGLTSFPA
jgi:hypothetical protein